MTPYRFANVREVLVPGNWAIRWYDGFLDYRYMTFTESVGPDGVRWKWTSDFEEAHGFATSDEGIAWLHDVYFPWRSKELFIVPNEGRYAVVERQ